jgi:hypothetical protein
MMAARAGGLNSADTRQRLCHLAFLAQDLERLPALRTCQRLGLR